MGQREPYVRAGQGHTDELGHDVLELYIVRLEELAPCRHIVEQVAHAEISTSRRCDLLRRQML